MKHILDDIVTEHAYPPIPIRQFDWRAWIDGMEDTGPTGWASTEIGAIEDLKEQLIDGGYKLTAQDE